MSNITAYGWEDQGSKHVCTTGDEDHITLFSQGQSDWNTPPPDDVTYDFAQQTPPKGVGMTVGTSRVGYAWPGQGWQQIAYVSSDGHICEIASPATGGWGFADLSGNGPVSAGKNIAAFAWNSVGTKQVVYVGQNGHIHELSVGPHGKWGSADLTARAKSSGLVSFVSAPSADLGMIAAFAWDQSHQKTVVFRTPDGHIHALEVGTNFPWKHTNLTEVCKSPVASLGGAVVGFASGDGATSSQHAVYTTGDGHVHILSQLAGGSWKHVDITIKSNAPQDAFATDDVTAYTYLTKGTHFKQVAFSPPHGAIFEMFAKAGTEDWHCANFSSTPGFPDTEKLKHLGPPHSVSGFELRADKSKQIIFETDSEAAGRHLHQLVIREGDGHWSYQDLSELTGFPG